MVASAAPAFAASGLPPEPPTGCVVTGYAKDPGQGQKTKGYYVSAENCDGGATIHTVQIRDTGTTWRTAVKQADGFWYADGFQSSQKTREVLLNGTTVVTVDFPPK